MKRTLLAVSAAALLAGTAGAWAQGAPGPDNNHATQHPAAQPGQGKTGPGVARPDQTQPQGTRLDQGMRQGPMERTQLQGEERNGPQGGQMLRGGEMRGAVRPLTVEQRTNLRQTVLVSGPRLMHVNFRIGVGAVIPRGIHIVPVPQPLLAIYPEWAGYSYFSYGNEIVVVDPASLAIVAVLPL